MEFVEEQRFHPFIILFLVGITAILIVIGLQSGMFLGSSNTPNFNNSGKWIYFFAILLMIGLVTMFVFLKLETRYNQQGIYYRFVPFQSKMKHIPWEDIESAYVRIYKPLLEYGGWGIRFSPKGKALTTKGNQGVQLKLKSGKSLLLGTQRPGEIAQFLSALEKN